MSAAVWVSIADFRSVDGRERPPSNSATDANNHSTNYTAFDANGYPQTETDQLGDVTQTSYDVRGEVLSVTDPLNKTTTQTYDTFGRPLVSKVPKDQAAGTYITTPAPVYDANDNVTQSTAPNGAVSTAVFDSADELTSDTAPKDNSTDPDRITSYTYDKVGNQLTATAPNGNLPNASTGSYTTTTAYDVLNRPVSVTDAAGHVTSTSYDDVGNTTQVVDPLKNLTTDTTDFTSKYAYDLDHRATSVADAAGHTKQTGYDKDGLQTSTTDEDGNKTLYTLDERGMTTQVQVPHDNPSGSITYDTTKYEYDQVGNQTKVYSPRAVAANSTTAFTTQTVYDELNRVKAQLSAYDPNDSTYNHAAETDYSYDADGHLTKVSAPPSAGQSVRNDTTYTYWDDGQTKSSTDPWDITTSYDHDELGDQTSRTITSAGGSQSRTMNWTYYPDGMVHTRTDNGVPVGLQVDLADNSDVQSTSAVGSWPTATSGSDHQGYPLGARMAVNGAKYAAEGAEALQGLKNAAHVAEDVKAGVHGAEDAADAGKAATRTTEDAQKAEEAEKAAAAERAAAARKAEEERVAAEHQAESAATAESKGDQIAGGKCSFSPDTKVLMGNGQAKPIGKVQVGDQVQAADPKTGKQQGARTVKHAWVNHDHDLVDVTIQTADGHTATLHTTANHPFYDKSTHKWTPAAKLVRGHDLQTPNGHDLIRVKWITYRVGTADRYNLTVEQFHTYYVLADGVAILVHNACDPVVGSGNAYSVAYGTNIPDNMYPGSSRGAHFQAANRDLVAAMDSDADFAKAMDDLIPGIRNRLVGPRGGISRQSPSPLWTWHHAASDGLMQLVPRIQHEAPGGLQNLFHPGGVGGFSIWG